MDMLFTPGNLLTNAISPVASSKDAAPLIAAAAALCRYPHQLHEPCQRKATCSLLKQLHLLLAYLASFKSNVRGAKLLEFHQHLTALFVDDDRHVGRIALGSRLPSVAWSTSCKAFSIWLPLLEVLIASITRLRPVSALLRSITLESFRPQVPAGDLPPAFRLRRTSLCKLRQDTSQSVKSWSPSLP